jgi:hypothetical protein
LDIYFLMGFGNKDKIVCVFHGNSIPYLSVLTLVLPSNVMMDASSPSSTTK